MGSAKGYKLIHTIEPKVYEPRLLALYAGHRGQRRQAPFAHYFHEPAFAGRVLVKSRNIRSMHDGEPDPVFELGQLLEEGMLAPFIHFGGAKSPAAWTATCSRFGSNVYDDS